MPTAEVGWAQLLAHPDVDERSELAGVVGMLAFHAGLERGTGEIAQRAATLAGASLYVVDQPAGLRWHVASRAVDPAGSPALAQFLDHVEVAVALHGYGRLGTGDPVLVGGTHRRLAAVVADQLRARLNGVGVVDDLPSIPRRLRGVHPANPVNRPLHGGVQVELPVAVRDRQRTEVVEAVAAATAMWAAG